MKRSMGSREALRAIFLARRKLPFITASPHPRRCRKSSFNQTPRAAGQASVGLRPIMRDVLSISREQFISSDARKQDGRVLAGFAAD